MTTLREALEGTPWRRLVTIGRRRGLRFSSNVLKADLVDRLVHTLLDPANLEAALSGLTGEERRVLESLVAVGGRMPFRSARTVAGGDPAPLERLRCLGILFYDRPTGDLFVPDDLIPHLLAPPALPAPSVPLADPGPAPADLLCHDLALFLALLQREEVRPLPGGWLPPGFLAAWGEGCAVPPASPDARSEKRTGRRRFLHYLAEAAGFVGPVGPFLKPTPAAGLWLKGSRADRLQRLWEVWTAPDPDRWRAFHLPGSGWLARPAELVAVIHEELREMAPSDLDGFARALVARHPRLYDLVTDGGSHAYDLLREAVVQLLTGPLVWLGVLRGGDGAMEGGYGLSSVGAAWLAGSPLSELPSPSFARFAVALDRQPDPLKSRLVLTLRTGVPEPAHLAVVAEVGEGGRGEDGEECYRYTLSAPGFVKALHRGWPLPALLEALEALTDRPLTDQEVALLRGWGERADQMALRRLTVLEVKEPKVLSRLASTRRGRRLIHRTLSRRAVVVDEARLPLLVRRLTRQEGVPPRVELPPPAPPADPTLGRGGAAHLWMAARLYQKLGRFLALPVHLPQPLLDHLAALADPGDLAAAEVAVERTLAALQEALEGRAAFPAWTVPTLPVEEVRALVEEALERGGVLEMAYYTAGRDEVTYRVVEPYRLERRGEVLYLVGFCRRAQAERLFRLDRVRQIVVREGDAAV